MFTGHLLALPVFYGVLNCLAAIISTLMDSVLYLFLYGYNGLSGTTQQAVAWLTPLEKLGGAVSWTQAADSLPSPPWWRSTPVWGWPCLRPPC